MKKNAVQKRKIILKNAKCFIDFIFKKKILFPFLESNFFLILWWILGEATGKKDVLGEAIGQRCFQLVAAEN